MTGAAMQGTYLRFYVHENRRHKGVLLYEWLLEEAKRLGLRGGSAFRAVAGFGRHGVIHEQHFFELAGDLTVKVEFVVTREEAERMLEDLREAKIRLVYAVLPADFGIIEGQE
jgi:PII-like signaling protein